MILALVGFVPAMGGVALLISSLKNLAVVMFPGWIGLGPRSAEGMAAMGQNLLFAMALALAMAVGMLPGGILILVAALLQGWIGLPLNALVLPLWGVLGAAPLFVEAALLIRAGGALWKRLDVSQEILEIGR